MNGWVDEFDESTSMGIAQAASTLRDLSGMDVCLIGFRTDEGKMAISFAPGFELDVLHYLEGINWRYAVRLAEEHLP